MNLNLKLSELKAISSALHVRQQTSSECDTSIKTINKAIEACEAKEKSDNDYAKKFYESGT